MTAVDPAQERIEALLGRRAQADGGKDRLGAVDWSQSPVYDTAAEGLRNWWYQCNGRPRLAAGPLAYGRVAKA